MAAAIGALTAVGYGKSHTASDADVHEQYPEDDSPHERRSQTGPRITHTRWWPPFCLVVDWTAATIIAAALLAGVQFHNFEGLAQ